MQDSPSPQVQAPVQQKPAHKPIGVLALVLSIGGALLNGLSFIGLLALAVMVGEAANDKQFYGTIIFGIIFYSISVFVAVGGLVTAIVGLSTKSNPHTPKKTSSVVALVVSIGDIAVLALIALLFFPIATDILSLR